MLDNLKKYNICLASKSPRRQELLSGLNINFKTISITGIAETYPIDMPVNKIPEYLSELKSDAYAKSMTQEDLIITADTLVISDSNVLGKPQDRDEAIKMLLSLSNKTHKVITGVTIKSIDRKKTFSTTTDVTFAEITTEEAEFYVDKYKPFDKAGSYGIQEWIGYVAVKSISGSFYNVMGLPIHRLYQELKKW